jgi:hypothetical protein
LHWENILGKFVLQLLEDGLHSADDGTLTALPSFLRKSKMKRQGKLCQTYFSYTTSVRFPQEK